MRIEEHSSGADKEKGMQALAPPSFSMARQVKEKVLRLGRRRRRRRRFCWIWLEWKGGGGGGEICMVIMWLDSWERRRSDCMGRAAERCWCMQAVAMSSCPWKGSHMAHSSWAAQLVRPVVVVVVVVVSWILSVDLSSDWDSDLGLVDYGGSPRSQKLSTGLVQRAAAAAVLNARAYRCLEPDLSWIQWEEQLTLIKRSRQTVLPHIFFLFFFF